MAGTVIADKIQAASTSTLEIMNGVALTPPLIEDVNGVQIGTFCRAWVNFNGQGTVTINNSFNVSSITDNGVGAYVINMTNAMPDITYVCVGTISAGAGHGCAGMMVNLRSGSGAVNTTTTQPIFTSTDAGSSVDPQYCNAAIFR
jgi:hypothetical protein